MKELIFLIEDDPSGGFARGLGKSIFTEAESWDELKTSISDAVKCHFNENECSGIVKLHYVKNEVIEVAS